MDGAQKLYKHVIIKLVNMRELDKVLDRDEKVFWEGKPKFWPFFLSSFAVAIFGLVFLVFGVIILLQGIARGDYLFIFFSTFLDWCTICFWYPNLQSFSLQIHILCNYKQKSYFPKRFNW